MDEDTLELESVQALCGLLRDRRERLSRKEPTPDSWVAESALTERLKRFAAARIKPPSPALSAAVAELDALVQDMLLQLHEQNAVVCAALRDLSQGLPREPLPPAGAGRSLGSA